MDGKPAGITPITTGESTQLCNLDAKWKYYGRCIIKLGTAGTVFGFDIDTTHFNGNEGPQASVEALFDSSSSENPQVSDSRVRNHSV